MKKIVAILFGGALLSILLIGVFLFLTAPKYAPFRISSKDIKIQFEPDGRGVYFRNLIGADGKIIATLVVHQNRANFDKARFKDAKPGPITARPKELFYMDSSVTYGKIDRSVFIIGEEKINLANGPWLFYFSDLEPYQRIHVDESKVEELEIDTRKMTPREFLRKWIK